MTTEMTALATVAAFVLTVTLAVWNAERLANWFAEKFLPELDDKDLQDSIDRWNNRHKRG